MRACIGACVRACVRECVRECVRACHIIAVRMRTRMSKQQLINTLRCMVTMVRCMVHRLKHVSAYMSKHTLMQDVLTKLGLYSYGLSSYGLYSYGLCSYGLFHRGTH